MVVLDREQGAKQTIEEHHKLKLHALFTITEMLNMLEQEKIIDVQKVDEIRKFIATTQTFQQIPPASKETHCIIMMNYRKIILR